MEILYYGLQWKVSEWLAHLRHPSLHDLVFIKNSCYAGTTEKKKKWKRKE